MLFVTTPKNCLSLPFDINKKSINKFLRAFNLIDGKVKNIFIDCDSNGGETDIGLEIVDRIINSKSRIITHATFECNSAAAYIFIFGEKRFITKKTTMIIHPQSLQDVKVIWYNQFASVVEGMDKNRAKMIEGYLKRTSIKKELVIELMTNIEGYYTSKEILEFGIADKIISMWTNLPLLVETGKI